MQPVAAVVYYLLRLFLLLLIVRLVMEYVFLFARSYRPTGPVLLLLEVTYSITDPPLKLLRRFLPPLKLGTISFDLGFLVLFIVVGILSGVAAQLPV